ncbi:hypothetical protein CYMTET_47323 [Cymbomonas tetramitiformis]|uniref:Uncharacterized protein n=1 Tax=Cymbomonas tetramitiformis TaxID=36881 RepID=A0AAE0EWR5_9CHLO|nr:hypothetical protein CYMTET_57056 [Cymbomonas tetramitiformis]KAK3243054.1 hypothetical protein CYMTET_47323 [Cymbomonas tetramitiformis]
MRLDANQMATQHAIDWCPVCDSDEYGTDTTEDGDSTVCQGCGWVTGELIFGDETQDSRLCASGRESRGTNVIASPPRNGTKRSRQNYEKHVAHADNSHTYVINDDRFLFGEAFDTIYSNTYKTHYNIYNNGKRASDSENIDRDLHTTNFWKVLLFINHTSRGEHARRASDLEECALRDFQRLLPLREGRLITVHRSCDLLQTMARYNLCSVLGDLDETNGGEKGDLDGMVHLARLPLTVCARSDSPLQELGLLNLVVQEAEVKWHKLKQKLVAEGKYARCAFKETNLWKRKSRSQASFEGGADRSRSANLPGKDVHVHLKRLSIAKRAWISILKQFMAARCAIALNEYITFVTAAYGDRINRKQWKTVSKQFGGVFRVLEQHLE